MPIFETKDGRRIQITPEEAAELRAGRPIRLDQGVPLAEVAKGATGVKFENISPEDRAAVETQLSKAAPGLINPAKRQAGLEQAAKEYTPPGQPGTVGSRALESGKFLGSIVLPSAIGAGSGVAANALIQGGGKLAGLLRTLLAGAGGAAGEDITQRLGLSEGGGMDSLASGGISALAQALSPRKLPKGASRLASQADLLEEGKGAMTEFGRLDKLAKAGPDIDVSKLGPHLFNLRRDLSKIPAPADARHAKILESIDLIAADLSPVSLRGKSIPVKVTAENAVEDVRRLNSLANELYKFDNEMASKVRESAGKLVDQIPGLSEAQRAYALSDRFRKGAKAVAPGGDPYAKLQNMLADPKFGSSKVLTPVERQALLKSGKEASELSSIYVKMLESPTGRQFLKAGISPTGAISQGMINLGLRFMGEAVE